VEDKELKKKLRRVPDLDPTGEPIWKIERAGSKTEKKKRRNLIPFPPKDRDRPPP
jgi:hypothetical protein